MSARDFPQASRTEGLRFTAYVALPNVVQGLFSRRPRAVSVARALGADRRAFAFMRKLKVRHGDGPLWIRAGKERALLVLGRDAIRHVLGGSPDPFASDPEPKRSGMLHFQPDALTISRGAEWEDRRRFTEEVLDTRRPQHRLADRIAAVAGEEAARLPAQVGWQPWNEAFRRMTRRVILGESAAGDESLSAMLGELMGKSNPPGKGDDDLYERYTAKLATHVERREGGSVAGLFADAPVTEQTRPAGQVTHWLFALGDTLAVNAFRCVALLAGYESERERAAADPRFLEACLQEAMRLWPTTPMLSRVTVRDADWDGVPVPAGTQVLIVNAFNHRDRTGNDFADRFEPEQWLSGAAAEDWSFNQFSHGPQGCPGAGIALLAGTAFLTRLLQDRLVRALGPALDGAQPLPHALDHFSLRFELPARG